MAWRGGTAERPGGRAALGPTALAALWMGGAILSFSSMAVAGRAVAPELDTFELMLYRSILGIGIVLAVCAATGRLAEIRARRMGLHALRNVSHFAGQNLWFHAITVVPLAQAIALEFTSPLWVALLAPLVLGERLTRARTVAVAGGLAGVVAVTRPWGGALDPGLVFAALAAVGFAGSALFTKKLVATESLASILLWLTVMQAILGLLMSGWDGEIALPSAAVAPWVGVVALAGLSAHLCLTSALKLAPASVVMPMDFLRLPLIAFIGAAIYGEGLDPWVALGAAIIVGANWVNLRVESRARLSP